ncbi:MAG: glycosyltransferase family 4 protein [Anaerolineae bacterium]|nr:glycosyltransferase family 4 protein [Anaerolineae bacterium]
MTVVMLVLNPFTHDARVHKEAKTLAAAGHKVTVIALWRNGLPLTEIRDGYHIQRLRLRSQLWRGKILVPLIKYLEFVHGVVGITRQNRVTVFHAHDANTLPAAWLAAKLHKAALIYDAHELETGRNFGNSTLAGIYRRFWALPEQLLIRKADAIITVCNGIADELVTRYGITRPTVVVNCPERYPAPPSNRLREELSIPQHLRILLYVGTIAKGRGLEVLLTATQRIPEVATVLLGDGPLLEKLQQQEKSDGLQRVYLPGKVPLEELPSYVASADIGITTIQATCRSYYYALPNKLFEYIHAGIPVIGSNLPEIANVIRSYEVGEVVDPNDLDAVTRSIRHFIEDSAWYEKAQDNTQRATEVYNWERESEKLLSLYERLKDKTP